LTNILENFQKISFRTCIKTENNSRYGIISE
jgi:hypothetical protein